MKARVASAYAVAAAVGAIGWVAIGQLTNRREAWDSEAYFAWFLPSLALTVAVLAFIVPERPWRWALVPFGAQAVVAFVQNPTANLLPLGLIVFAFFALLCLIPAWCGAAARRLLDRFRRKPPGSL
jgi:hypothetical protein